MPTKRYRAIYFLCAAHIYCEALQSNGMPLFGELNFPGDFLSDFPDVMYSTHNRLQTPPIRCTNTLNETTINKRAIHSTFPISNNTQEESKRENEGLKAEERSERMALLPRNQYPGTLLMSELYKKLFIRYLLSRYNEKDK